MEASIRPARVADVVPIAEIINDYAERGRMLHRSHADLYEGLRDLHVAEVDGRIVGVTGLRIIWSNLAEVYALAIAPDYRGKGVGKRLVEAMAVEAARLGIRRIFALTYEREFFERCGFHVVNRHQTLPAKVWSECLRCPKNQACDEIAMVRELEHVPEVTPPEAPEGFDEYQVPAPYDLPVLTPKLVQLEVSARK